ncbi:MAG: TonB-dependent receptor [Gemmatimonadetes bacterium]|nr:TonB-dependent receptor [Gemmatimonadota bacterium]MBT6149948.1 TonB-dependent receptor [Gemmatimonadota bacterium]MBT7860825.1 TonB-dependent receptor [Gemmatimonadota bacterium]
MVGRRLLRLSATVLVVVATHATGYASVPITGRVIDGQTGESIADVQIVMDDTATVVTDSHGRFQVLLPDGQVTLSVWAVGYHAQTQQVQHRAGQDSLQIHLVRRVIELSDEIVIYGKRATPAVARATRPTTTAAALDRIDGVGLVRRANFGFDPAIRGTQPSQVGVVIEGMKIFHACVDRMDPVTSYVETENLDRLEITRGGFDLTQGAMAGGVVNLITQKPHFDALLSGSTQTGVESASGHRFSRSVVNVAKGDLAARGSFSFRTSGQMRAGGGDQIDNTQYSKYNYKLDLVRRSDRHRIEVGMLADEAWDIGYPALLMDARRASSRLYHAVHTWTPTGGRLRSLQTKVYVSAVDHWMDDDDRDVTTREVMRDMYMPMFGRTRAWGVLQTLQLGAHRQTLKLVLDAYEVHAFADMEMISINPDVATMYLLNLGQVERRHGALTADYQRSAGERWQIRANLRFDGIDQDLTDPMGRRQMAATWGDDELDHRFAIPNVSTTLAYQWQDNTEFSLGLSDHGRVPTQLESYGFYLYNPADGYFYTGQPKLKPERGRQIEIGLTHEVRRRRFQLRLHYSRLTDYIAGVVQESIFKTYENIPRASLMGAEVLLELPLTTSMILKGNANYTRGHNDSFHEPLPFVPPLEGRLGLLMERDRLLIDVSSRIVARQMRIADRTSLEDETPGYVTLDLRAEYRLGQQHRLEWALENALDRRYHEHLSVENFPSPGRNLRVALALGF